MERDFVVVGAGVAGCVAAHTLAASGAEVLVLEAGPGFPLPPGCRSVDLTAAEAETGRWWDHLYPAGRGVGGGSAVNGLIVQRPDPLDPAVAGLKDDVEAVLDVLDPEIADLGPLSRELRRVCGDPHRTTIDPPVPGFAVAALSAKNNRRRTAADAWLDPALANLTVFAGNEMMSVDQADGLARKVVVAAGALRSPAVVGMSAGDALDHASAAFSFELPVELQVPLGVSTPAATALIRTEECQILIMDHTGDSASGRIHGAAVVMALTSEGTADSGVLLAADLLAEAGIRVSDPLDSVPSQRARVAHACCTLAGMDPPVPVVDASTLAALPTVNPMVVVAAHARALSRAILSGE